MIDFSVPDDQTYQSKKKRSLIIIALVAGALLGYSIMSGHSMLIFLVILALIVFIQVYRTGKASQYFIRHLKIQNDYVHINYKDKEDEMSFTGKLSDMTFRKEEEPLSRTRSVCLVIHNKGELLIRQYLQGGWTEAKFDEIEQYIRKLKTVGKEIG